MEGGRDMQMAEVGGSLGPVALLTDRPCVYLSN